MRLMIYIFTVLLLAASCSKTNEDADLQPIFFPTDLLFEELQLDRFSHRIPDAAFSSGPATFSVHREGGDWDGFAISNRNHRTFISSEAELDATRFSVYAGAAPHAGGNFLVVKPSSDGAEITLDRPLEIDKFLIAPTTHLYQTILYGPSTLSGGVRYYTYATGARVLSAARRDYVKVVIKGYNGNVHTGDVSFFLADRNSVEGGRSFTVASWLPVSLEALGPVDRLVFYFESLENLNGTGYTPPYFCIDGIRFKENIVN